MRNGALFSLSSIYRLQDYPMMVVTLVINYNEVGLPDVLPSSALFGWQMPW